MKVLLSEIFSQVEITNLNIRLNIDQLNGLRFGTAISIRAIKMVILRMFWGLGLIASAWKRMI